MSKKSAFERSAVFRMNRVAQAARTLAISACLAGTDLALAQTTPPPSPPSFSQLPATASWSHIVAPNIILSIDDSSSMSQAVDVPSPNGGSNLSRIAALKGALNSTFGGGTNNTYLNKIRLGFQAMWNNRGFGPNRLFQANAKFNNTIIDNSLRKFDTTQQTNFLNWVNTLTATSVDSNGNNVILNENKDNYNIGSTPSQFMMIYAGEYLKGKWLDSSNAFINFTRLNFTDVEAAKSPWNQTPGTADPSPLACRRAYHIFLTDGLWNIDQAPGGIYIFMPYVSDVSDGAPTSDAAYGNNNHTLPDGTVYSASGTYSAIYRSPYPDPTGSTSAYSHPYVWADNSSSTPAWICGWTDLLASNDLSPGQGTGCSSTLADFAFYYWATNLTGKDAHVSVKPQIAVPGNYTVTSGGQSVNYPEYWNPQNDPATWQHMQTYTIGYGTQSGTDSNRVARPGAGEIMGTDTLPAFDSFYGTFYSKFASGAVAWPGAMMRSSSSTDPGNLYDLVHAAYNGRGKFYAATTQDTLTNAFNDILKNAISGSTSSGVASAAASNSRVTANSLAYVAGFSFDSTLASKYDPTNQQWGKVQQVNGVPQITGTIGGWSGSLAAYAGNDLAGAALWNAWIPAAPPPAPPLRNVYTSKAAPPPPAPTGLAIPFAWAGLSADSAVVGNGVQQMDINAVLNNPLGDIVNSQLVYVDLPSRLNVTSDFYNFVHAVGSRTGVVYVGANDGMLHGFDSGNGKPATTTSAGNPGTGKELMAYVPRGLLTSTASNLHNHTFASQGYKHHYWVDGSPFAAEAQLGTGNYGLGTTAANNPGNWATVLTGTLGAGGPGYFVLDVTQPSTFSTPSAFAKGVLIDATDTSPSGPLAAQTISINTPPPPPPLLAGNTSVLQVVGNQFSPPVMDMYTSNLPAQIIRINTNKMGGTPSAPIPEWAVIMGNGYGSAQGMPVLLIQSLSQKDVNGNLKLYTVAAKCMAANQNTCITAGNGLGAPRPIDADGNGTADIVYAGDLMGNLWKFDISNPDQTKWNVAFGGNPLFTAVGPTGGVLQPITSAPAVVPNKKSGYMVVFGTGKNLFDADTTDKNYSTIYGLYDAQPMTIMQTTTTPPISYVHLDTPSTPPGTPVPPLCYTNRTCLYAQTGGNIDAGTGLGQTNPPSSTTPENIDGISKFGWYFDIPDVANNNAAKVLDNPVVMSQNMVMIVSTNVMSASGDSNDNIESCDASATVNSPIRTLNFFDLRTGMPPNGGIIVDGTVYPDDRVQIGSMPPIPNGSDQVLVPPPPGTPPPGTPPPNCQTSGCGPNTPVPTGRRAGWHIGR